ncbi:amidohydrolase 3 [Diaporthe amygdali]|uniref:amidohydrolase 3 n=1 Tax=Phomopsis amygdali TaxID=1214568 RepID=UPI0022FE7A60|nr:amidohydrolase 3 [Diaporthe amygdali]KAJ0122039.1 amidohydrolase 3 [Diaporthe amygdali]
MGSKSLTGRAFWLFTQYFTLALGQNFSTVADTVLCNGKIYTLDAASSQIQALAINDGVIVFTGSDDAVQSFIGSNITVINLDGRMAMPGLIDAHMHTKAAGEALVKCNLNYATLAIEQVLEHLQKCIDAEPEKNNKSQWLDVVNFDLSGLATLGGLPTKADLDKLNTTRPVILTTTDHHTYFVNSAALKISGINASTPNPAGGRIDRLPGGNEPSGLLQDQAYALLAGPNPLTQAEQVEAVNAALRELRQAGVTTFQEAVATQMQHSLFLQVQQSGDLSARPYFDYQVTPPATVDAVDAVIKDAINVTTTFNDKSQVGPKPVQKWQAIKLFMDGIIQSPAKTGAVLSPYLEQVGNSSEWTVPPNATIVEPYIQLEPLAALLCQLASNGIDVQLHADGDGAVRRVLDAVERFRESLPNVTDYKIAIAHAELSSPDDWPRFAELGVDAILSFQWAQPSATWQPLTFNAMGPDRMQYLEAFVDIASGGRPVIYGSDWPVRSLFPLNINQVNPLLTDYGQIDPLDEFLALKSAVTRQGDPENSHSPASHGAPFNTSTFPGKKMEREPALRAITIEAAKFLRADSSIGSLEVGKVADVIILDRNYFEVPEEEIARQKVLLTMLGGEVVYVADGADFSEVVTPKFPNINTTSADVKNVGGFAGRRMSEEAKALRAQVGRRHACHD